MGKADLIFGSILFFLSTAIFVLTIGFPHPTTSGLSPSVFPRFVSVCMGSLSILLIGQGVVKSRKARRTAKDTVLKQGGREARMTLENMSYPLRFSGLAVAGLGYVRLINNIGYIVATPLLIAAAMLLFGEKKWYRITAVSLITSFVLYGLFRLVFRVPLPRFTLW